MQEAAAGQHIADVVVVVKHDAVVLAALSAVGGFLGLPHVLGQSWIHHWLGAEYGSRRFANPVVRRLLAAVLALAAAQSGRVPLSPSPFGLAGTSHHGTTPCI